MKLRKISLCKKEYITEIVQVCRKYKRVSHETKNNKPDLTAWDNA